MTIDVKVGDVVLWNPGYDIKGEMIIGMVVRKYNVSPYGSYYSLEWSDESTSEEMDASMRRMLELKQKFMEANK